MPIFTFQARRKTLHCSKTNPNYQCLNLAAQTQGAQIHYTVVDFAHYPLSILPTMNLCEGNRELSNEIRSQSPGESIGGILTGNP